MPTFKIKSFGCKVNRCEADELAAALCAAGFVQTVPGERADAVIVNGCAVTAEAERKAGQYLRRARREHPGAVLALVGCAADLALADAADVVIPQERKGETAVRLAGMLAGGTGRVSGRASEAAPAARQRTRLFLKVQDGCPNGCAYCVVSLIRNSLSSMPSDTLLDRIRQAGEDGCREAVLSGINLGLYRCPESGIGLTGLIRRILAESDLPRLHLSSLEPEHLDEEVIGLFAEETRLLHHLHVPLQSGDDAVLAAMGRRYDAAAYLARIEALRQAVPAVSLTTDLIAGFPGEDEAAFGRTVELARQAGFSRMHVFPYSDRPGTPASAMSAARPSASVRKARARRLLELSAELNEAFLTGLIGEPASVLLEREKDGFLTGLSERYARYYLPAGEAGGAKPGEMVIVKGASRIGDGLLVNLT